MNKLFNRFKKRKGFTLVECIVAVAVFAVMVLLVFAILTRARLEAQNASQSEEDLTTLIDNVVGDETYKKFKSEVGADGKQVNSMQLAIAGNCIGSTGETFDITYNIVDGYKNYVLCSNPDCKDKNGDPYFADNTNFMFDTSTGELVSVSEKEFDLSNSNHKYICPNCQTAVTQTLVCEDCTVSGNYNDSDMFTYIPSTGGYFCNNCGGTSVKGNDIDEKVVSDSKMSISSVVPNAIRYGDVAPPASEDLFRYMDNSTGATPDEDGIDGRIDAYLEYNASANMSVPGTYTLRLVVPNSGYLPSGVDDGDFTVKFQFPQHYMIYIDDEGSSLGNLSNSASAYRQGDSTTNNGELHVKLNMPGTYTIKFQLVNYKSGFSFEYDYNDTTTPSKAGLAGYWFQVNPTIDIDPASGHIKKSTASFTLTY